MASLGDRPVSAGAESKADGQVGSVLASDRPLLQNAAAAAAEAIRQAIFQGRLSPGDRLKEEQLAEDLGMSRTPIREALLILQTEGMLKGLPRRGSVVRSYGHEQILDLYETRAVLEAHAAGRAATRATAETIGRLRESCRRFEELTKESDPRPLVEENSVFHAVLLDAAESPSLKHLVVTVTRLPLIYRSYYWLSSKGRLIALHYHEQITHALEQADPIRAEWLMREHILEARDAMASHLKELDDKG